MKISVIIPVYNVVEWLDKCMETIAKQSFLDFEVLLIDDGSTDDSDVLCNRWAEKDKRVRVIRQENAGPSAARNRGIREAEGDFLAFVDADDWVHKDFLKKLYDAAVRYDADMVECDVFRVDDRTGEMTYHVSSGSLGKIYSKKERMKYGYTPIWKCLFKKELFDRYHIEFPNCHSEAKAIYPLLVALSNSVVNVREGLYYYRRFRKDSLTAKPRKNNGDEFAIGIKAFEELLKGFEKNSIFEEYHELLEEIVKYKLSDMLAALFYRRDKETYQQMLCSYRGYISNRFPGTANFPYITLGGYNLNRIAWNMNMLHDSGSRYNFSSIISIMSPLSKQIEIAHKNNYRKLMIERDVYSLFWDKLRENSVQYLLIDFIEERFDIIKYQDAYITKSDAWDDAEVQLSDGMLVKRHSEECTKLWKKKCRQFVERLQKDYPNVQIVLVKNYLCEKVGSIDKQECHHNIEQIKQDNSLLQEYYHFFETVCEKLIIVDESNNNYYFTDKDYEYGAIPSHVNEISNRYIAKKIEQGIGI